MRYLNLRQSQVILDPENPRLPDGTTSDREAINRLLDDDVDGLVNLARDLAKTGQANPSDLPIAMKEGNKYLILEGNRRFAALKLLKDPTLAYSEEHQKHFRRAAGLGSPPSTVYTLIMANRDEADRWIFQRHTGENLGVGIKRWSASQIATHRRRKNKPIDSGTLRSLVIADSLEEAYAGDEEIVDLVRQVRREKLTNIGRFFSPDVFIALHFSIRTEDSSLGTRSLYVCHTAEQLRDFFAWAMAYIRDKPVDAYKNAGVRQEVLRSAAHLIPGLEDAAAEPFRLVDETPVKSTDGQSDEADEAGSFGDETGANSTDDTADSTEDAESSDIGEATAEGATSQSDGNSQTTKGKKAEAKPDKYLFQGLKLPNHSPRIQALLKECRLLPLEEYPGTACVMARVMVELSVSSPRALQLSGSSDQDRLNQKIIRMLRYLDPDIEHPMRRNRELAQAFLEASDLGVQYLNAFVHNFSVAPDHHLARRFSNAFRPLLTKVDEAL